MGYGGASLDAQGVKILDPWVTFMVFKSVNNIKLLKVLKNKIIIKIAEKDQYENNQLWMHAFFTSIQRGNKYRVCTQQKFNGPNTSKDSTVEGFCRR